MKSDVNSIDEYLENVSEERHDAIARVRQVILEHLPALESVETFIARYKETVGQRK